MSKKPISFNTEMVRAIPNGHKSLTRRVVKPQPPEETKTLCGPKMYEPIAIDKDGEMYPGSTIYGIYDESGEWGTKCPWHPGDLLYVRETWQYTKYNNMDGDLGCEVEFRDGVRKYFEFNDSERYHQFSKFALKEGWQPSIYMPKEAARIWLEVTNVRVERVQDITEEDARKEGCTPDEINCRYSFAMLWDSLYAKPRPVEKNGVIICYESYPWDDVQETREYKNRPWIVHGNPWVWVIEFKRVRGD